MPAPLTARLLEDVVDPVALFRALAALSEDVFWLDAGAGATDGWSLLGVGERSHLPAALPLDGPGSAEAGLPPFRGGWIGWCDYESGARTAGAPVAGGGDDSGWMQTTRIVAIDHEGGRAWAMADGEDLDAWVSWIREPRAAAAEIERSPGVVHAVARHTPEEYSRLIDRCRELIRAGTAYQLCLTTRFTVAGAHDAVAVYLRLRASTPAHHGGFLRIGGRALLSASPEQFLYVEGGEVRTRPIKGTRPRSADPETDAALAAELAADVKERAENVMIVDLMRNDLSRVCEPGSIRVDGLWQVESYPAVHQLVSAVSGRLIPGTTVGELLAASFPAGSMTGAPKLSAMTRLHALEAAPRGIYAGCFGYIGVDGRVDLAMVIRSIVMDADGAAVGAGGGITWGSVPASEVAEVATKARAPLAALGAVLPGHWGSDILN